MLEITAFQGLFLRASEPNIARMHWGLGNAQNVCKGETMQTCQKWRLFQKWKMNFK